MHVDLENVINGNKELSDSVNAVINQNWKDVFDEINAGIDETFSEVVRRVSVEIFDALSYDDFFKSA